jgi:ketosteroid isomerase-like protein
LVRGREGLLGYVRDLDEVFTVRDVQFSEFRDLGDRIVVLGHVRGRGKESGIEFDSPYGGLAEFRNGKCVSYRDYFDLPFPGAS